jgi:hypothetical protein
MRRFVGKVTEVWEEAGELAGWVACPAQAVPMAGQYLLAVDVEDRAAPLPFRIFPSALDTEKFASGPGMPRTWLPGTQLNLSGPLGRGFSLPPAARQIACACLDGHPAGLRPLVCAALEHGCGVTLFADGLEDGLERWPTALEISPLQALAECLSWADYLAMAASPPALSRLHAHLELPPGRRLPFPAQALVDAPFPCGGIADCGACAVRGRRGWKLACKDGPVFDLNDLEW